jgi:hypothetical protein
MSGGATSGAASGSENGALQDEQDDTELSDSGDGIDQLHLRPGQVDVRGVAALSLGGVRL